MPCSLNVGTFGKRGCAFRVHDAEDLEISRLDLRTHLGDAHRYGLDMAADQGGDRRRRAVEGNVFHLDAGLLGHQSRCDMPHGTGAGIPDRDLIRMGLGIGDEILHIVEGGILFHGQGRGIRIDPHQGIEVLVGEGDQTLRGKGVELEGDHPHGVTIGIGVHDGRMTDAAAAARVIDHRDRLPEKLFRLLGQGAQQNVGPAAGGPRDR